MYSKPKFAARHKEKLNDFIEKTAQNAAIDYRKQEIQDIRGAVIKVLDRVRDKMNERGLFKVTRMEPGGSMAEHTSLWKRNEPWKWNKEVLDYIEFDFLAVLELPSNCGISPGCQGCMVVKNMPWNKDLLGHEDKTFETETAQFDRLFKREISISFAESCSCLSYHEYPERNEIVIYRSRPDPDCENCIIKMSTGCLHPETWDVPESVQDSSLMLKWTSSVMSLSAFDETSLQSSHQVKHLPVCIDFIPALEILKSEPNDTEHKHDYFLVPKKCHNCDRAGVMGRWRVSKSLMETNFILNQMSPKHRNCYIVLKFLLRYFNPFLGRVNNYHMKTAVLHHSARCRDDSEDYAACLGAVLTELAHAYDCGILPAFGREANITGYVELDHKLHELLAELLKFKSWKTFKNAKLDQPIRAKSGVNFFYNDYEVLVHTGYPETTNATENNKRY